MLVKQLAEEHSRTHPPPPVKLGQPFWSLSSTTLDIRYVFASSVGSQGVLEEIREFGVPVKKQLCCSIIAHQQHPVTATLELCDYHLIFIR